MTQAVELERGGRPDDRLAVTNAVLLSLAQGLYSVSVMLVFLLGGIVGASFSSDPTLATLPVTALVVGSTLLTAPLSLFMQRFGRRAGFILGTVIGIAGMCLAAYAIVERDFWLFCISTLMIGAYQASSGYYRFAAADTASDAFKPKAISWVLAGGIAGALFVPTIVAESADLLTSSIYAGTFLVSAGFAVAAIGVQLMLRIPLPEPATTAGREARSLGVIFRQPGLVVAVICGMLTYGLMNLVMTATPLAMQHVGHDVGDAANSIRWHVVAMYGPSFFTGHLIARFGAPRVMSVGLLLMAVGGGVALHGLSATHFTAALILLGVGWNFGFVGATTLVTDFHRPSERGKVQAINDFCVFGFVGLSSYLSGKLLFSIGWSGVVFTMFPVVAAALVLMLAMVWARARTD